LIFLVLARRYLAEPGARQDQGLPALEADCGGRMFAHSGDSMVLTERTVLFASIPLFRHLLARLIENMATIAVGSLVKTSLKPLGIQPI
jgi:hypothetical protein